MYETTLKEGLFETSRIMFNHFTFIVRSVQLVDGRFYATKSTKLFCIIETS